MVKEMTYDKVSWHYPEGKNCPSLEAAKMHFDVVMHWLESQNLLSTEGREAMELGIDAEFFPHLLYAEGKGESTSGEVLWGMVEFGAVRYATIRGVA